MLVLMLVLFVPLAVLAVLATPPAQLPAPTGRNAGARDAMRARAVSRGLAEPGVLDACAFCGEGAGEYRRSGFGAGEERGVRPRGRKQTKAALNAGKLGEIE
jgi:hypothetical protein